MEVDGASEPLLVVESAGPNGFAPVREIGRADAIATFGMSGREATEVGPLSFFPCVILLTLFLVIEGIEVLRAIARVRHHGVGLGLLSYDVSQGSRNFTFGMFYAFTLQFSKSREGPIHCHGDTRSGR